MKVFPWELLGDLEIGRPNLGLKTDVVVYRLMQYTMRTVLEEQFGEHKCRELLKKAGKLSGLTYCRNVLDTSLALNDFIADLSKKLIVNAIGILHIEKSDLSNLTFVLTVSEDLDCSGLPINGLTVCDYDEGFIAGIMEEYTGYQFNVVEIDCWANGDRTCRFDVRKIGVNE
jgi:hypothetical protein